MEIGTIFRRINHWVARPVIFLIRVYQHTFSPDHGALKHQNHFVGCRFYPSCSEYSVQAFQKYGFVKGLLKTVWRVLRCNPWSKGGVDKP
ncbi:membrane protein insertion efficiency factor YidD [bacterium DOLZORAL124_38_8]|nr:MAG: membrane protein insertion efficiency factor YidD [bacterium DOLZORAL124_38_8]